jgi:tetratricopeptide (TPR) repeat protein
VARADRILNLPIGEHVTYSVSFSPDGECVACGGSDGKIRIWKVSSGTEIMTINAHEIPIYCIAYSPDGKSIVSASADCTAKVWDTITGNEIITLRGHEDFVISAKFSPDAKLIITGSNDRTAKLWDAATGVELLTFPTQRGADDVTFSPDGKTIAVGTFEGFVELFESTMPPDGYEPRKNGTVARKLVDEIYKKCNYYYDVINTLQADRTIDESIRKIALRIANAGKWEDADKLRKEAWATVSSIDRDVKAYKAALEEAAKANAIEPNDPTTLDTLAAGLYRTGSYEDALKTLSKSAQILSGAGEEPDPVNVAFKAMILYKIDRTGEAKAALGQLRKLCKDGQYAEDTEVQGFLAEAEGLIGGKKP